MDMALGLVMALVVHDRACQTQLVSQAKGPTTTLRIPSLYNFNKLPQYGLPDSKTKSDHRIDIYIYKRIDPRQIVRATIY
jgi:hypothetical protein